jgi:hypothetical protein
MARTTLHEVADVPAPGRRVNRQNARRIAIVIGDVLLFVGILAVGLYLAATAPPAPPGP